MFRDIEEILECPPLKAVSGVKERDVPTSRGGNPLVSGSG
jgi:hypothetical protein